MDTRSILIALISFILNGLCANAADFNVKPGAFAVERALQETRVWRMQNNQQPVTLHLQPGVYRLNQPIILRPEDSGITLKAD